MYSKAEIFFTETLDYVYLRKIPYGYELGILGEGTYKTVGFGGEHGKANMKRLAEELLKAAESIPDKGSLT